MQKPAPNVGVRRSGSQVLGRSSLFLVNVALLLGTVEVHPNPIRSEVTTDGDGRPPGCSRTCTRFYGHPCKLSRPSPPPESAAWDPPISSPLPLPIRAGMQSLEAPGWRGVGSTREASRRVPLRSAPTPNRGPRGSSRRDPLGARAGRPLGDPRHPGFPGHPRRRGPKTR